MATLKLKKIDKPAKGDLEEDITWFCDSLGLSSGRDTESVSNRIMSDILKKVSEQENISSDRIAEDLDVKKGLVNHHLRNLIDSGIIRREKKQILIRGGSLKAAVHEIRRETLNTLEDIEKIAREIDNELGIMSR